MEDVLEDFRRGWTEGQTDFNGLVSQDIEGLMASVSAQYPGIRFYVRGMGEEFNDVWLRQFDGRAFYLSIPNDDLLRGFGCALESRRRANSWFLRGVQVGSPPIFSGSEQKKMLSLNKRQIVGRQRHFRQTAGRHGRSDAVHGPEQ